MRNCRKTIGMICMMILSLAFFAPACVNAADVIIVIDPGHGGAETGATRNGYKEEVINQKIANYLKAELETYEGVKVYMTRNKVSQQAQLRDERVNIAKKKEAAALVSIHINSTGATSQTRMSGAYAIVPSTNFMTVSAQQARRLGSSILKSLHEMVGLKNNGYWIDDELGIIVFGQKSDWTKAEAEDWGIARETLNRTIPTMIIEHCFINNPNDRSKYLSKESVIKKMGVADATGIANYYRLSKKGSTSGTTQTTVKPEHTGKFKLNGKWYLYDEYGYPVEGLVKYKGKYYCADANGKLYMGWKVIDEHRYYFNRTDASAPSKGWQVIGVNTYYFTNKGYVSKRWKTIDGGKYYFSKVTGILLKNYWLKYEGKWYYLNKNGNPYTNCKKKIDGVRYTFDKNGVCLNK